MRSFLLTLLILLTATGVSLAQDETPPATASLTATASSTPTAGPTETPTITPTPTATVEPDSRLMFMRNGALFSFDLTLRAARPLARSTGNLTGAAVSPDGVYIAYDTSDNSLRWLNTVSSETTVFHQESVPTPPDAPNPRRYLANPHTIAWSADGKLLITQALPRQRTRIGYTEVTSPYWSDLPARPELPEATDLPEDQSDYGCGTMAWSPDGMKLAWASGGPSPSTCRFVSGLTIIDFATKAAERIVAKEITLEATVTKQTIVAGTTDPNWSADGEWITFAMRTGIERTPGGSFVLSALYKVRPDGSDLTSLGEEDRGGWVACPIWVGDKIYYVRGTYTDATATSYSELYRIDTVTLEREFVSSNVTCISNLSSDGRYAVINRDDDALYVWSFADDNAIFVTDIDPGANVQVVGWLPITLPTPTPSPTP